MASNTSKTARASVRAGQSTGGALSVLGEYKYLIPLANGRFAYVRNLTNGKTAHLKTDSEAFVEEIRILAAAGHGAKIRAELESLEATNPQHGLVLKLVALKLDNNREALCGAQPLAAVLYGRQRTWRGTLAYAHTVADAANAPLQHRAGQRIEHYQHRGFRAQPT